MPRSRQSPASASQAIAEQMRVYLVNPRSVPPAKRNVENIEAYDLYLRGQYYAHRCTPEALILSKFMRSPVFIA
jgi:hypothetical protein